MNAIRLSFVSVLLIALSFLSISCGCGDDDDDDNDTPPTDDDDASGDDSVSDDDTQAGDDTADDDISDDTGDDDDTGHDDTSDDDTGGDDDGFDVFFSDDFESYTVDQDPPIPWVVAEYGSSDVYVDQETVPVNRSCYFEASSDGAMAGISYNFTAGETGKVRMKFDVYLNSASNEMEFYLQGDPLKGAKSTRAIAVRVESLSSALQARDNDGNWVDCGVTLLFDAYQAISVVADIDANTFSARHEGSATSCTDVNFEGYPNIGEVFEFGISANYANANSSFGSVDNVELGHRE
jgi:hypothetical protein